MDKRVLEAIVAEVKGESPAVLATIIRVTGSVPRHEGAKMLIFADGRSVGTIGGGCGEAEVRREAFIVLSDGRPKQYKVLLNSDLAADEGMVCGGVMEVFLEPLVDKQVYAGALDCLSSRLPAVLVTAVEKDGSKGLYDLEGNLLSGQPLAGLEPSQAKESYETGKAVLHDSTGGSLFFEPVLPEEKLLVLGAGHVAQDVAAMGKMLDFHVTVVDDRPDFASKSRFPHVDQLLCLDFVKAIQAYDIDANTYIVIVTRGHQYDEMCLRETLGSPAKYLGMIGSRRRVKLLLHKLQQEGSPEEILSKVNAPIGLKIGAETPAEIAVSILAEIITVRRKQSD